MFVDTHCHLDFYRFDADRAAVVARAVAAGVGRIVVPAISMENVTAVLALAEQFTEVYAAVGIHPNSTAGWDDSWLESIRDLAQHEKVVAIGEIGLDYYWDKSPQAVQHHAFRQQLQLAAELDLPVIVHNREASADVVRMLRQTPGKGVLHSFAADGDTAVQVLDMGYYLGFTGPVTYKKAAELRQIAAQTPLDRIVVETDAPFLAPEVNHKRPSRNEPAFVTHVAERIAREREMDTAVFAHHTTQNAARLFPKLKF
ncbi:MAG TPA: TatD family hydrolase [Chloroflexota bacterium]|nr:TatD family hydrolase [Chloroflexota bacterium]